MSRLRHRLRRLTPRTVLPAVLVCLLIGLVAGLAPGRSGAPGRLDDTWLAAAAATEPGDRVSAAVVDLQRTGLHVGPELADQLGEEDVDALRARIAASPVPLFVVWWADTYDGGYSTAYAALAQLRVGVGEAGYYALVSPGRHPLTDAVGYRTPYVDADGLGRPLPALTRLVDDLAAVPPEPIRRRAGDSDYWGGPGGGIAAGLLFAVGTYLVVLIVVAGAGVRRRRRRT
ncbi:MAG: hypothetical protein CMH83_17025 [Nocardioides sp.]|nr:hypothetical protein [Nocardioides sp.]